MGRKKNARWLKFRVSYRYGRAPWRYVKVEKDEVIRDWVEQCAEDAYGVSEEGNGWSNLEWTLIDRPPREYLSEMTERARSEVKAAIERLEKAVDDECTYSSETGGTLEESDVEEAMKWLHSHQDVYITPSEVIHFIGRFGIHPRRAAKKFGVGRVTLTFY